MTRDIPIYSETAIFDMRAIRVVVGSHHKHTQVCAVDINEGVPRRLTTGARDVEGVTNGVADYCAMEEMDRYEGFWLSPTGNRVCFERVDETDVYLLKIPRPGDAEDPGAAEEHRYPFSGATNPSVKLGVVDVSGGGARDLCSQTPVRRHS